MREFDFNKPEDARRFLTGFRLPNGTQILYIENAKGQRIMLDKATDAQICQYASQIYEDFYMAKGAKPCYYEEPTQN